ncbi:LpxL/LpxP family acyltransferase [Roseateles oligotrophus]|uniref:Acyltransferase n=1 Tax=Roseateles oligotrophus TaxID=1769250 RepID=A0ABT2YDE0_9BURK|nr:acyltransferase [Roseateles oligotrophus]MCV2368075.1 acyltransferase [Roseateles oligotrophus]
MSGAARNRHWADLGESTFVAGIWLLYGLHRLTGRWGFRLVLAPVVLFHWLSRPGLRRDSLQYLRRLHDYRPVFAKPPGWPQGLRHVALFAETMLDKLLAIAGRYPVERVTIVGAGPLRQAAAAGQGGIIVTAHIGCLELCRALIDDGGAFRLNVLVHTAHAQDFNRILQRLNPHSRVRLIEVTEIDVGTAMLLSEKVAAGEFVAIAGDRIPVRQSKTVLVDFLGHPAQFPVGPYVLAGLLKCPLYMLSCLHAGRGYAIRFDLLAQQVLLPRGQREQALQKHAEQYVFALSELLHESPYDWFNFFPFWDQTT